MRTRWLGTVFALAVALPASILSPLVVQANPAICLVEWVLYETNQDSHQDPQDCVDHFAGVAAGAIFTDAGLIAGHHVYGELEYEAKGAGDTFVIIWRCDAQATPDPASTGIGACSVNGTSATPVPNNVPGAASTAVGAILWSGGSPPIGCIEAHATFIEGILGPESMSAPLNCEPLNFIFS